MPAAFAGSPQSSPVHEVQQGPDGNLKRILAPGAAVFDRRGFPGLHRHGRAPGRAGFLRAPPEGQDT